MADLLVMNVGDMTLLSVILPKWHIVQASQG